MGSIIRSRLLQGRPVGLPLGAGDTAARGKEEMPAASGLPPPQFEAAAVAAIAPQASSSTGKPDAAHAQRLADEIEQATQKGFERGFAQGSEAAQEEYEARLRAVAEVLSSCQSEVAARLDKLDDDLIELVFVAVTRIVGDSLQRREGVTAAIEHVLQAKRAQTAKLLVRISASDWETLGEDGRRQLTGAAPALQLVVDSKVEIGGCLIEMDRGTLDGRLETQLAKLKQALVDSHVIRRV